MDVCLIGQTLPERFQEQKEFFGQHRVTSLSMTSWIRPG
jgi:hypothetical protein